MKQNVNCTFSKRKKKSDGIQNGPVNTLFLYVGCLTFLQHANCLVDESAQITLRPVRLRKKLQIKLAISPGHGILTPAQPVLALTYDGIWQDGHWSIA